MNTVAAESASQLPSIQFVAVPTQHVPAVYKLLADISAAESAAIAAAALGDLRWNDTDLRTLTEGKVKTTEIVTEILDQLAAAPGQWFAPTDLAELLGRESSQLSTLGTHISRHLAAHYTTTNWPFEAKEGKDLEPRRDGAIYYSLNQAQAEQWNGIRGEEA